jgi:tetratricopeptide (TPR) repeat protein
VIHPLGFRHRPPSALPQPLRPLPLVALLLSAACAPALTAIPAPDAREIPGLEAELQRSGGDAATMVRLGAAYRAAGQPERARPLLERAVETDPTHAGAVLFLGLTYEDAGEVAQARSLYQSYLTLGMSSPLRSRIEGRLPLLRRREFEVAVRQVIAQEAQMVTAEPQPRTVAVFPFHFASQDTTLEPLSRAIADLLTTDLSQTDRLAVLERTRVQILLDELRLGEQGLVDPASAARGGRLLGAERLVQGSVGGGSTQIQFDAAVVHPWTGAATANDPAAQAYVGAGAPGAVTRLSESDAVQRLFDAEKRLALRIYETVGVVLTAAEREAVNRRPTENLQAILAYGRGLRASDAGDWALAAQHFSEAARLDPNFAAARQRAEEAEQAAAASLETTIDLAFDAGFEARLPLAFDPLDVLVPGMRGRDPAQEVMGTEGYDRPTILEVIIRRPSGGQ